RPRVPRLGRSDGDGAWCPAGPVFPEEEEFLEVDLGRLHVVTLVGTQGRHAGGHGREFARAYRLRYSRDRHRWLRWRDRWAGLLSYTAPRGQVMALDPAPVVLNDSTYDGYSVGPVTCPNQPQEFPNWPQLVFSHPQVHCNNMHTRGVSIFGEVECRFKRSLATAWEPTPATHSLAGAVKDPSARSVTVPLGGRQARFIQCHFFFAGEWMLFSEITFLSDVVEEAVGASGWPPAAPPDPSAGAMAVPEDPWHVDVATNLTTPIPAPTQGTFTPASDAWAFGVTLWEVLTRCREQPYGRLSDEQVIANAGHHFRAQ
ncbi:PREDICTED: epithelial discoidin domain-containing receptor 1, partial [Aptenodytes forsteri]|uniref:epithelial discoidin domain-containing receptor 1 n=1 Tax=Aptenodytes forsteri TaxID=9233 RepID=UPI000905C17B